MRLGAIKERRSQPNKETWKESGLHMICLKKESGLHIESGQITAEAHLGAYGKKIKGDLITYQMRGGLHLWEISK